MKKLLYHKLVRDRIPEIIKADGKQYSMRHLSDQDLTRYSFRKLREEVQEFVENPCAEEAADILEIFEFICEREGIGAASVKAERISKRITKGGFNSGILLGWVDDS
jgi:predicted house-cleaning noncanonical NTP pyrophosphatase (MazG superfamily)